MPNPPLPVQAIMQQENLQSLLWVQSDAAPADQPLTCLTPDAMLATEFFQRFDLVFVDATAFTLEKNILLQVLAKARDLLSSRVLVECPVAASPHWRETDFLGLGMRRRAVTESANGEHVFYSYDLKTYKQAPDWLNPKYWANPHMWNKARW